MALNYDNTTNTVTDLAAVNDSLYILAVDSSNMPILVDLHKSVVNKISNTVVRGETDDILTLGAFVDYLSNLSKSTDGTQGPQGPKGLKGSQGPIGLQGIQGNPGANSKLQGPKGAQGDTGMQGPAGYGNEGPKGNKGIQGHSQATNQYAQGPQGLPGDIRTVNTSNLIREFEEAIYYCNTLVIDGELHSPSLTLSS